MKTLVVEDDFTSRLLLQELLKGYGPIHIAVNGKEAVDAVRAAREQNQPYDLICLDIMMPDMDGQAALEEIRALENPDEGPPFHKSKIIMTTALSDRASVAAAIGGECDYYLVKPIEKLKLLGVLGKLGLIK